MTPLAESETIDQLRADYDGGVIAPGDAEYDEARTVFVGGIDRRPAAIVRPSNASEVSKAVSWAREAGVPLAVRSGGHSGAGHGVVDDGIVIDLREMRNIEVDAEGATAWAQTGLTAGEYSAAVGAHGLATGFGDAGSVGIGGITLGGGVGYLSRLHGLTIDSLLAAEIVTADGEVREIDADRDPDLFWAVRGAGANFGVVTRFKFRLQEVANVVGGMMMLPASPEVLGSFLDLAGEAPDELSTIVNVTPAPPMPFVPEEHQGELVVMALICFAGPPEEAEAVLAPFRELAEPIADMVQPIPYPEIYPPDPEDYHPTVAFRTLYTDDVDAGRVLDQLESAEAPMRVAQFRVLGGAIDRIPNDGTAYAHRGQKLMANVVAFYEDPSEKPARQAWVDGLANEIRGGNDAAYVNFLADDGPERVRAAYPHGTFERLAELKRRYDSENLFRSNQNIPPAPQ